jgi:hypothetical protein
MEKTLELYWKLLKDPSLISELTKMQCFDVVEYAESIKEERAKLWWKIYEANPLAQHIRIMSVRALREGYPQEKLFEYLLNNDNDYSQASKVVSIISTLKADKQQVSTEIKPYISLVRAHAFYIYRLLEYREDTINQKTNERQKGNKTRIIKISTEEFPLEKSGHHNKVYEKWLEIRVSETLIKKIFQQYAEDSNYAIRLLNEKHPELTY